MKYIVKDNEIAFVMKNGKFVKTVMAGKYHFSAALGYTVAVEEMLGEVNFLEVPYEILQKDKNFAVKTKRFQIADGRLGFVYKNGNLQGVAVRNEYVFWNVFEEIEIKEVSMEEAEMSEEITKKMLSVIPTTYYTRIAVAEGEVALLYFNNQLEKTLESGIYHFWNYGKNIGYRIVDQKWQELNIIGQEILTKDKIGIRLNVVCNYRIVDAVALAASRQNVEKQLYSYAQLIIRELVGNYRLDEILERKVELSEEIAKKLRKNQESYCVEFQEAGIKDIILPGEIREIMNTVLVAEKKAQANVIERREEVASTRSLLNTAKLMEENETLYQLKKLEYMERICSRVGEITLSGKGDVIEQLGQLLVRG